MPAQHQLETVPEQKENRALDPDTGRLPLTTFSCEDTLQDTGPKLTSSPGLKGGNENSSCLMQMGTWLNRLPEFFLRLTKSVQLGQRKRKVTLTHKPKNTDSLLEGRGGRKKRLNPLKSQATLNNFPEVQGHQVQERVLSCLLPHLPCNCKLKEKRLTDGRSSKHSEE